MPREILTLSLGVAAILLATQALHAQDTGCADRARLVDRLVAAGDSFERVDAPLPGDPA